jgi:hypothetical protein
MTRAISMASVGLALALLGCVGDDATDQAESKPLGATPEQKSTACAVGDTPNSTQSSSVRTGASYTRLGRSTIDQQCACELWEQKYNANYATTHSDADAEAAADKAVPQCRPATYLVVDVVAVGDKGYTDLVAQVDGPNGIGDPLDKSDCTASNLVYAVDELEADGVTWNEIAGNTTSPTWNANATNCDWAAQTVPVTHAGTYRLRAKAHYGAESNTLGYLDITLAANPADNPT